MIFDYQNMWDIRRTLSMNGVLRKCIMSAKWLCKKSPPPPQSFALQYCRDPQGVATELTSNGMGLTSEPRSLFSWPNLYCVRLLSTLCLVPCSSKAPSSRGGIEDNSSRKYNSKKMDYLQIALCSCKNNFIQIQHWVNHTLWRKVLYVMIL